MKKVPIVLIFLLNVLPGFSQNQDIDKVIEKFVDEKDPYKRIDIFYESTVQIGESNPVLGLKYAQKLLEYSKTNKDRIGETYAMSFMGKMYTVSGNVEKGLEYAIKGKNIAEQTGNVKLIALTNSMLGLIYMNLADYPNAIDFYTTSIQFAEKANYPQATVWGFEHLSEIYLIQNQVDSALMYGQKGYSLSQRINYSDFASYTLNNLGAIHAKLGNPVVANGYLDMAVNEGIKSHSAKQLNFAYTTKSEFFKNQNKADSAIIYAKKAIDIVQNTAFSNYSLRPAKMLLELYKKTNSDSAIKYSEIYRIANDSLYNARVIHQTQLISFEEHQRQKELKDNQLKTEKERKLTIQYALIALGIIILVIIYLMLSHSFITNPELIHFFGVIALLLVFEFMNLLLHPLIGNITDHSPLLMLLALVCTGALLIPLHHKIEKWAITKLVEKNKQIRLAAAKKTIQELETKNIHN